ncbi:MAG: Transcriptional regulator MntR [candidate division WS2 bacterium]|nr:Transcriptional regulator MntR [Candidatus Lithacetigena glycinireducens]MBT9174734.1 Transcriptional regulator MntR [Candidatus Lithacetigena glycinireducens]
MNKDKASEDYLEAIFQLSQEGQVTVSRLSDTLLVSKSAVSQMLGKLKEEDLVTQPPYGSIKLTNKGSDLGKKVAERHRLLVNFLTYLGVTSEIAEKDACLMEHGLHEETIKQLLVFINKK